MLYGGNKGFALGVRTSHFCDHENAANVTNDGGLPVTLRATLRNVMWETGCGKCRNAASAFAFIN